MAVVSTVVAACVGAVPGVALGAVTVGSDLSHPGVKSTFFCTGPSANGTCTYLQTGLPGRQLAIPSKGILVRWRVRDSSGPLKLRIVDPLSPDSYYFASGTATETASGPGVLVFPARLPVAAGNLLSISASGSQSLGASNPADPQAAPSYTYQTFFPSPLPGEVRPHSHPDSTGTEFLYNADIEPDIDGDGFGDETQDRCPGIPGSIQGCPAADLSITNTVTHDPRAKGNLIYTLTARNNGPDTAPAVTITDQLPPNVSLVGMGWDQGNCTVTDSEPSRVACDFGTGGTGAAASVTLVVQAPAEAVTNTATISSSALIDAAGKASGAGDTNAANDSATTTVRVLAPTVWGLQVSPSAWHLRSRSHLRSGGRSRQAHGGTSIGFSLTDPATVALSFSRGVSGRRVGRRCQATSRRNHRARRCTRQLALGSLRVDGHPGANTIAFAGHLRGHPGLGPGRYVVTATATDAAGNSSQPRSSNFRILAGG